MCIITHLLATLVDKPHPQLSTFPPTSWRHCHNERLCLFFFLKIDAKKVSSIKDLIEEAQPDQEQLEKQQEVAEKLTSFLMVRARAYKWQVGLSGTSHTKRATSCDKLRQVLDMSHVHLGIPYWFKQNFMFFQRLNDYNNALLVLSCLKLVMETCKHNANFWVFWIIFCSFASYQYCFWDFP